MNRRRSAIRCYVLASRMQRVLELFAEEGGPFDLVIEGGCRVIGGRNWRCVRMELDDIDLSSWEALAACEWIKAASSLDVIFDGQTHISRDIYCHL